MNKALSLAFAVTTSLISTYSHANTDVIIADIKIKNGHLVLANHKNISARTGYDNQPNFAPDNSGVYYTAMFETGADSAQTDTLFYRFADGKTKNITNSKNTSEYSPTPYLDGERLSFIKVEEDGTQRLWSLAVDSGQQTILNQSIKPVGYHAWGNKGNLALFVLGEPMTLQYVDTANQAQGKVVAGDIGRSIRYNSSLDLFSFSQGITQQQFSTFDVDSQTAKNHIALPSGSEYYTWLDDRHVLSAQGNRIMIWPYGDDASGWRLWVDAKHLCSTTISRMNINHDQSKIAVVCDEQ